MGTTAKGLWRSSEQGGVEQIVLPGKHNNATIQSLLVDRNGAVWAGLFGRYLFRYQNGQLTTFSPQEGMIHEILYALYEAQDGTLWIGGEKGLTQFRKGQFKTLTTRDGLSSDRVSTITQDRSGNF